MKKVVLAFSGGLDTSYCAIHLSRELGYDVHAVTVNTGGFDAEDAGNLRERAHQLGVSQFHFLDETQEFYEKGVRYLLFGNILKNNTYPLSVSAERVFQASRIAAFARDLGADAIAHGSTGAGNDQIRFDLIFHAMCPAAEIITPIRDKQLSRNEEVEFLEANGIRQSWDKAQYSINKGLWGTSVGGKETLTSDQALPEEAFPSQKSRSETTEIKIQFYKGEPTALDGEILSPVELIEKLNKLGGAYAIGRDTHVGDTIIGIKGRVGFEAPAALMLIKAHHLLEKHVLSKYQMQVKEQVAATYGNLMHEGLFLDPVMRDIEAFLHSSQRNVTGEVYLRLNPYRFQVTGVTSEFDLMQSDVGQYGEMNKGWTAQDARGFAKIFANQTLLYNSVDREKD